jgi:hypothetical protein
MRELIDQASAFCEDEHIPKWFGMPFLIIGFIGWKIKEKLWKSTK